MNNIYFYVFPSFHSGKNSGRTKIYTLCAVDLYLCCYKLKLWASVFYTLSLSPFKEKTAVSGLSPHLINILLLIHIQITVYISVHFHL